jgi:glycosyltransferase involved in cell wall biosynthesis
MASASIELLNRDAKPKVVRIISRLNVGGPARQACFLHQALRNQFETTLVTGSLDDSEGDMSYLLTSEAGVRRIPSMSRPVRLWADFLAFLSVVRILRAERPDLVHTHAAKAGTLGRLAAAILGVPVRVHTYHGNVFRGYFGPMQTRIWLAIERTLNKVTTATIVISESQVDELVEKYNVVSAQRVRVIRNGYDLSPFGPGVDIRETRELRRILGYDDSHFVALWAGRLVSIKNVQLLAQIAHKAKRCPGLRFLVVGDGADRKELETLIAGCPNIQVIGWRKDIPELWAAADAALVTSRNEGTPSSLIEGMASGKPFVSTNVGGVIDLAAPPTQQESRSQVIRAGNGFLTSLEADPMVDCLEFLAKNPDVARAMGEIGRSFALSNYSHDRLQADIENLYFKLLEPAYPGTARRSQWSTAQSA